MSTVITTSRSKVYLDESNILHLVYLEGSEEKTSEDALESFNAMREVAAGNKYPTLVDLRLLKYSSRESRKFWASKDKGEIEASTALVVKSGLSRTIGNFYFGVMNPVRMTKMFTSRDEAMVWLKGK